ncbi:MULTISPECIES: YibE/F family protein [unclassified Streptomyces]|uniref:YibE/F family protein n=1 Tax=unclassified Streptomyces TaxID=2593676 RepID=UPI00381C2830
MDSPHAQPPGPGNGHAHGPGHGHSHGHSHGHGHGPVPPVSRHLRKVIAAVLIPFVAAVVVGLVVLWPNGVPAHKRSGVGFDQQTQSGRVVRVENVKCADVNAEPNTGGPGAAPPKTPSICERATIRVTSGKDTGRTFTEIVQPTQTRHYTEGQKVLLSYAPGAPKELQYSVTDVDRALPLWLLAGLFAAAVVVVGRLRGFLALAALIVSFAVLTLFILPAILHGSDPLLVAVIGGSAIMLIALYMCHGLNARTSVAVLGTLCSLLLIALLGSVFIDWAVLSGNTSDETGLIHDLYPGIEIHGLLLAGIVIGSLGVLDDVTVTQTSAVWELRDADPGASWHKLYRAAMRIGRDHIASVVNTLVLAYAGAALPLLLLFSIAQRGVLAVAGSELVAEEIVRTLVGSIGLVVAVPLTTALAALVVSADRSGRDTVPTGGGRRRRRAR